jgi:predicted nucleotidyltransferase component of viral defense system
MVKGNILEILEKHLSNLLKCSLLPEKSYLAGGTAVYFYLKHRISVDLDFFTPTPFNSELFIPEMKECFDDVQVELMEKNTVILFLSKEKIKFSLFLFPYDNLVENKTINLADGTTCPLASLDDIEAMKSIAISQRGSAKDFVDLYLILRKTGHRFDDILKLIIKKYELESNYEYQLKTSFVYFEDAEKEVDNIIMIKENKDKMGLEKNQWLKIKNFFLEFIK